MELAQKHLDGLSGKAILEFPYEQRYSTDFWTADFDAVRKSEDAPPVVVCW